jgi:pimeloyl-ACP methyl ester carboxylesterase
MNLKGQKILNNTIRFKIMVNKQPLMKKAILIVIVSIFYIQLNAQWNDPEQKEMNAVARKGVTGSFIQLTDGITHYEIAGAPKHGVVVLVHGFSVPYFIWNGFFENLVSQGFQVIRYDEYGRGYSDRLKREYTSAVYTQQLKDLIKGLKIKTPVNIIGVSFGGIVSTNFTLAYPQMVKKVILIDPASERNNNQGTVQDLEKWMGMNSDKRAESQLEDFKYPNKFPNWVADYKVQMQYKGTRMALASTSFHYDTITYLDRYKSLNSLKKPVLLIWGTEDRTVPLKYSDSIKAVLNVRFLEVHDAGHLPYLEKPEIVNKEVLDFLNQK